MTSTVENRVRIVCVFSDFVQKVDHELDEDEESSTKRQGKKLKTIFFCSYISSSYPKRDHSTVPTFALKNLPLFLVTNWILWALFSIYPAVFDAHNYHINSLSIRIQAAFLATFKAKSFCHCTVVLCCYEPVASVTFVFAKK